MLLRIATAAVLIPIVVALVWFGRPRCSPQSPASSPFSRYSNSSISATKWASADLRSGPTSAPR